MLSLAELENKKNKLQKIDDNKRNEHLKWWTEFRSINGGFSVKDNWSVEAKIEYNKRSKEDSILSRKIHRFQNELDNNIDLVKHSKPTIGNYSYLAKKFGCNKDCREFKCGKFSSDKQVCQNVGKVDIFDKQSPGCSILKDINTKIADLFFEDNPPCKTCIIQVHCSQNCDKLKDYNKSLKLRGKVKGYDPNTKVKLVYINHNEFDRSYSDAIFGKNT